MSQSHADPQMNTQQQEVSNSLENIEDGEDGSGMKVRSELKAGTVPIQMGLAGIRGGIRTDILVGSYSLSTLTTTG